MTDYNKLLEYALKILAKKRYTTSQLKHKLKKQFIKFELEDESSIDLVIERLIGLNYLDDEKFIEDFVNSRIRLKPRGKFIMIKELTAKGLPSSLISAYFQNNNLNEEKIATNLLNKKFSKWENLSLRDQKLKASQFLYSKGFNREAIYKAVNRCYNC